MLFLVLLLINVPELAFIGKCLSSSNNTDFEQQVQKASSHGNLKLRVKSYSESVTGNSTSPSSKESCTAMEREEVGLDSL